MHIFIDGGTNVVLRERYARLFTIPFSSLRTVHDDAEASRVCFTIHGVLGSASTRDPAVRTGKWPFKPTLRIRGRICG